MVAQNKKRFQKLKRVVVKEEFVALTGDFIKAIILNQFLYWSERVQDFDKFIQEEKARASQEGVEINMEPTNGWIYKKAEELAEETMLNLAPNTILRHIKVLIDNGWLLDRHNPAHGWDRTKQYRVNIVKIYNDLLKLGYVLQEYKMMELPFSKMENGESTDVEDANSKIEDASSKIENASSILEVAKSKMENGASKMDFHNSKKENRNVQNGRAIPEITNIDYKQNIKQQQHLKSIDNRYVTLDFKNEKTGNVVVEPDPNLYPFLKDSEKEAYNDLVNKLSKNWSPEMICYFISICVGKEIWDEQKCTVQPYLLRLIQKNYKPTELVNVGCELARQIAECQERGNKFIFKKGLGAWLNAALRQGIEITTSSPTPVPVTKGKNKDTSEEEEWRKERQKLYDALLMS